MIMNTLIGQMPDPCINQSILSFDRSAGREARGSGMSPSRVNTLEGAGDDHDLERISRKLELLLRSDVGKTKMIYL